jgi:hypothetical protein
MIPDRYPILEFDAALGAIIEPAHIDRLHDVAERCVIGFLQTGAT